MKKIHLFRSRVTSFLVLCGITILVLVFLSLKVTDKQTTWIFGKYFTSCEENIDFRRETAEQLLDILRELKSRYEIDPRLILKLNGIASQLDPRYLISDQDLTTSWSLNSSTKSLVPENATDVCPEVFVNNKHGRAVLFQEGFIVSPTCNVNSKKPISELVTVILNAINDIKMSNVLTKVVENIRKYHSHIPIIIAINSDSDLKFLDLTKQMAAKYNIKFLKYTQDYASKAGKVWNYLVAEVKTPYVILGRDLVNFNSYARLERQIYVISASDYVKIVGGSFRNATGHWKVGCYQTEIKNYFLRYIEGYRYSAYDCMFCDYLEGPFIADTKFLTENPYSNDLHSDVVFDDWFLQIKYNGALTLNCPDAMYFVSGTTTRYSETIKDHKGKTQSPWLTLAKKWAIHRIFLPPKVMYLFSCKEVGLSCMSGDWVKSYLLPSCCLVQVVKALKALDDFTRDKGLRYELDSGSLLGAVKLRSFMPWDRDGDINFDSKDYKIFYKNKEWFRNKGFKLDQFEPKTAKKDPYFKINTPDLYFEMWGSDTLSNVYLPADVREMPTKVNVLGLWVRGQANPALYSRNRYGPNYLKHVQHWEYLNMKDSWQLYNAGSWLKCPKPQHHACLDHYPADGSIDFLPQTMH